MRVEKVGRTTGLTSGRVFDVSADISVEYEMGVLSFQNQILIQSDAGSFSDWGDSGSVIVDRQTRGATAMLFAASKHGYSVANRLSDVLTALATGLVK